jgi:hypothetical protein
MYIYKQLVTLKSYAVRCEQYFFSFRNISFVFVDYFHFSSYDAIHRYCHGNDKDGSEGSIYPDGSEAEFA